MKLSAVMFDLDGTLADSLPGIEYSIDSALQQCGCSARSASIRTLIGPPIRGILNRITGETAGKLDDLESAFRSSYDAEGWQKTVLFDGVDGLLQSLQARGVSLFLVTNKPEHCTIAILERAGLRSLFTEVICRNSSTGQFGSKAEMVAYLVERHHVAPETCLFVGDTREDHHAAAAAGIPAVLLRHGYGFSSEEEGSSLHWVSSIRELTGFLHF